MSENKKEKPVITLIGAGSRVFAFNMCTDICQTPALQGAEIRLMDIDEMRLTIMEKLFRQISQATAMDLTISSHLNRQQALAGTDFVIISVANSRIDRWETDLKISRKHGIVEPQGECGGPGGLSLTLRMIPLIMEIVRDVETHAPNAVVLNFSNPMTRVCHAITRYTCVKAIGLCHGVRGIQNYISRILDRNVDVTGCGINHFNWIFAALWRDTGKDAWESVVRAFRADISPEHGYTRELFEIFGRIVKPAITTLQIFCTTGAATKTV